MSKWETWERTRLAEQAELDSRKSPSERNALGQFATPSALALEMAEYVRVLWTGRKVPSEEFFSLAEKQLHTDT